MVNACVKMAGVAGSSLVAIASLAISIAEYIETDEATSSSLPAPSPTPSSTPSSSSSASSSVSYPGPSPSSSSSSSSYSSVSSSSSALYPTLSPSLFVSMAPTLPQPPSFFFFSPAPSSPPPSSPSSSIGSFSSSSSSSASRGKPMGSDSVYDGSDDDFNAMALGLLLASVFLFGVSCFLWRSNRRSWSRKEEEKQEQRPEHSEA